MISARSESAKQVVLPVGPHAAHHVETLLHGSDQPGDLLGRVLQVGVQGDDDLALGLLKSGHDGGMLAVVAIQENAHHPAVMFAGSGFNHVVGSIAAAVIHQDDFKRLPAAAAGRQAATDQFIQVRGLVENGNDHR